MCNSFNKAFEKFILVKYITFSMSKMFPFENFCLCIFTSHASFKTSFSFFQIFQNILPNLPKVTQPDSTSTALLLSLMCYLTIMYVY